MARITLLQPQHLLSANIDTQYCGSFLYPQKYCKLYVHFIVLTSILSNVTASF